jgi:Fe-Mn family superoxide dismutase
MKQFSRRGFLLASSAAAAGNFIASTTASAMENSDSPDAPESGLATGLSKSLRHKSIPGFLSEEQIGLHHRAHYGGALRGYKAADKKLESSLVGGIAMDSNEYGALQRSRSSKCNSVLLHELYFDNMVPRSEDPTASVRRAIEKRFGSLEKWESDFQASARTAAGWAMLILHPVSGKLYNVVSDEHASGPIWMSTPLLVIDVYEHAFYVDYRNRKAEYIEKFMDHVDWREMGRRYAASVLDH